MREQKLSLTLGRNNYVIMRGDLVVSGVFLNYSNALKEMYNRVSRRKEAGTGDEYPPFKVVQLTVSALTMAIEGDEKDECTTGI